jgi:cell division protein FtsN
MNLNTKVQPTPLSGRTWYRVQAGPFVGRRSVEAAENILRQNNIDPLRLRE